MIGNLPFLENKKLYNVSKEIGVAKITSCVAVDRGVACVIGDSHGYLSIFINEENAARDIRPSLKPDPSPPGKLNEQPLEENNDGERQNNMP
jgi:hypothetical protein